MRAPLNPKPANDNDRVTWRDQLIPAALGIVILAFAIRTALLAFF